MNFLDFVYTQSIDFWRSVPVQLISAVCISTAFLHFTRNLRWRWSKGTSFLLTFFLFCFSCLDYLNYFAIVKHSLILCLILFLYLTISRDVNYRNAMVITALFVSLVEFATAIVKESIASPFSYIAITRPTLVNLLILIVWIASIILFAHFSEPEFRHYEQLPLKLYHVVILLLPTSLFLFLRNTKFFLFTTDQANTAMILRIHISEIAICFIYLALAYVLIQLVSANMEISERYKHELLLSRQEEQYRIRLEVLDAVNRRYHDLKNFVSGMDLKDKQQLMDEMKPFETIVETGNRALNMLLSDKIQTCQKYGIRLVPYTNGNAVGFLSDLDICSLFGNILDNAIEAAKDTSNPEIYLKADRSDGFLIISEQNPFLHEPIIRDGRLISSKQEEGHGYGIRNMERILEKYDGSMSHTINNGFFELSILIPVPENR
ncbi:MAG: GHKL domain-containing protein [Bulleidia sp.]